MTETLLLLFTLVTGPTRSSSLTLSDTRVCQPQIRARLGTTAPFCQVVVHDRGWLVAAEPHEEREFFIDNLPVRIHFIIVMSRWTGLAPWEFEFPFPGSPVPSTTPTAPQQPGIASAAPSRSETTVAVVAAIGCVVVPELPIVVVAPALDAPVVLRSAASLMHPGNGDGCLQGGFPKAQHRSHDLPAAGRASCLATPEQSSCGYYHTRGQQGDA